MADGDGTTLEDVARAAGVSRATASRALLEAGPTASTSARARVRAVAARLGYQPNRAARALAGGGGTRLVVAVTSPSPAVLEECGYLARVVTAAAAVGNAQGVGVSLQWLPLGGHGVLHRLARDRGVLGVVLVNTTAPLLEAVPAVLRGRVASIGVGSPSVPSFDVDNGGGAAEVVRHLLTSGRRRIAMIAGPAWLPCAQRSVDAYRDAVRAAGLPARIVPGDFSAASGRTGAGEVLRRWPDTDAVFAVCDAVAFGAMAALRTAGVAVPADVAVAGFDDLPAAAWSGPALTTATHPVERIAAGVATALVHGGDVPEQTLHPSRAVLRESA